MQILPIALAAAALGEEAWASKASRTCHSLSTTRPRRPILCKPYDVTALREMIRKRLASSPQRAPAHFTASLIALTGLPRTVLLAGLAANFCFSFVNGLMPSRAGRAGFFTTTNFAKPWRTKTPIFFLSLIHILLNFAFDLVDDFAHLIFSLDS